jgi:putative methanogenesis marker 16 metalloprotein
MVLSVEEINKKLKAGDAVVLTAQEVRESLLKGDTSVVQKVDVVTTGTRGLMSGTYAILSFPIAPRGTFERATSATINGVPVIVGPCPNERLGILDLMVLGCSVSESDGHYGAGHLFRDLVERKKLSVELTTNEGAELSSEVTIDDMQVARLMATRHAFRNYVALINPGGESMKTIFHPSEFKPDMTEMTFSGCGQLNPIQNDPLLQTIGVGTRILVNGAIGYVTGLGTRSSVQSPNLMMIADMKRMRADYMGGFVTSAGPECAVSWAVPIPVIDNSVREAISRLDRNIPLPIADIKDRMQIGLTDYGQVWDDVDLAVRVDANACENCKECDAEKKCPTAAICFPGGIPTIDRKKCFNCGFCTTLCDKSVFKGRLGEVSFVAFGSEWKVPVVCRQSDRVRALKIARELKKRILDGSFKMTAMLERLL